MKNPYDEQQKLLDHLDGMVHEMISMAEETRHLLDMLRPVVSRERTLPRTGQEPEFDRDDLDLGETRVFNPLDNPEYLAWLASFEEEEDS